MIIDEKTQDLPKVAMSLNADLTSQTLEKFSSRPASESVSNRLSRKVPVWAQTALPFFCIAFAVALLGISTGNWIVAGITGTAGFIALGCFFAFAVFQRLKGQDMLKKDLLIAAVEAKTRPVAITDLNGALVCANSSYGRLLGGFPSPSSLPTNDEDREKVLEAGRSARVCGRGMAHISRHGKQNDQPLELTARRSRQIENYLVWDVEGAGHEAQIQRFLDLSESGLAHWLGELGAAFILCDASGNIRQISEASISKWRGTLNKPASSFALSDLLSVTDGQGFVLGSDGEARKEVMVTSVPIGPSVGEGDQAGIVYLLQPRVFAQAAEPRVDSIARSVFNAAPVAMAVVDKSADFLRTNAALIRLLSAVGFRDVENVLSLVDDDTGAQLKRYLSGAGVKPMAEGIEISLRDAEHTVLHITAQPLSGSENETLLFIEDTTERKSLEQQFAQAQKMQAVGQLAGGIAHDFNNILTAIIGFCDLLLVRHGAGDPSFSDIMQVKQNANRAANLVRQLLAFSRQQTLLPKVLNITDVLAELSNLIRRLIGENIDLKMVHGRDLPPIKVDQGQLEQVIVNLAVNARDAMDGGGNLTITTAWAKADEVASLGHEFMPNQDYIRLEVRDTGHGIDKENLNKIFEPFFTTKETGKGTGLGLSTVYGIVKQTGGFIFADSKPGEGAAFIIYLPAYEETAQEKAEKEEKAAAKDQPPVADFWGKGTILLVEDEDAVRTFASRALTKKGYNVVVANSGQEALDLLDDDLDVDLLISDVVMPQIDGPTLVKTVRQTRPNLRVVFISGYAQDGFGVAEGLEDIGFLPKPFSLTQLAETVKEALPSSTDNWDQD